MTSGLGGTKMSTALIDTSHCEAQMQNYRFGSAADTLGAQALFGYQASYIILTTRPREFSPLPALFGPQ
jgi:hypothetical protein